MSVQPLSTSQFPQRRPLPTPPSSAPSPLRLNKAETLARSLGLSRAQYNALVRAIRDSETERPKPAKQHKEDTDWLKWAMDNAMKYGPQLVKLFEAAL